MAKIVDVIQYEGDNSVFIWKHPSVDFNTLSQLIVHESQEAIFFMNGQALDLFGPGRHTLKTQNLPLLGKLIKIPTDGVTPFHCEVYFINKTEQMSIKWGTDSRVQYMEPTYGFPLSFGASGEMSLRAADSRKLLLKLVGTENILSQKKLTDYFRSFLMTKVKSYIAQVMKTNSISIFELHENLQMFSDKIKELLVPDFMDYGVSMEHFFVTNIALPEEDPNYREFKRLYFDQYAKIAQAKLDQQTRVIEAETAAQEVVIGSKAMATKREQEGYTYQEERGFDVAHDVARNEAVGQFTNMGVGLGTMVGVGGAMAGMVGGAVGGAVSQAVNPATPATPAAQQDAPAAQSVCAKCATPLPEGAMFCLACGEKVAAPAAEQTMYCPQCGASVPKGKFCLMCGCKLELACPKCQTELPPEAKFCHVCGEKL